MLASTILYIFVFLIFLVILIEYLIDRRYQAKRREERQNVTHKKPTEETKELIDDDIIPLDKDIAFEKADKEKAEAKARTEKEAAEKAKAEERARAEAKAKAEKEATEKAKAEAETIAAEEKVAEAKELPNCEYPPFTHVRLVEMGLSDDEAIEFVHELIPQLEEQVPLIEEAIDNADIHKIERLTHGIKGSATNIGTGGISDLLTEFSTYLRSETDMDVVKAYHEHFIQYIEALKKQYT